jgi:hypothetical protein
MLNSILQSLTKFAANRMVSSLLGAFFPAALGVGSTVPAGSMGGMNPFTFPGVPTGHTGGVIGVNIPKYHAGGEVLMMGQTGEGVISRKGMQFIESINKGDKSAFGGSNVEVNVINNSSQPVSAKQSQPKFDGKRMIVDVILQDLNSSGPISRTLRR